MKNSIRDLLMSRRPSLPLIAHCITRLMNSPLSIKLLKLSSIVLKLKSVARTPTLRQWTTPTRLSWIETWTLKPSMRLFKSIPLFWLNKTKIFRESWTLLWRPMTLSEEISIENKRSRKLDTRLEMLFSKVLVMSTNLRFLQISLDHPTSRDNNIPQAW